MTITRTAIFGDGEAFLNQIYNAVPSSPNWSKTVLIINFDEWGGFFDHVPPPLAPVPPASAAAGIPDGRLGFRVPCLVIWPYARRSYIGHEQFDHTSILKMIEWRFGLPPLTVRDQTANNLADVLNFAAPDISAPTFNVPTGPFGTPCNPVAISSTATTMRARLCKNPELRQFSPDFMGCANMKKILCFSILVCSAICLLSESQAQSSAFDYVVVVIEENHSFGDIIGNSVAPNINALASSGANIVNASTDLQGNATGSHAVRHPSH